MEFERFLLKISHKSVGRRWINRQIFFFPLQSEKSVNEHNAKPQTSLGHCSLRADLREIKKYNCFNIKLEYMSVLQIK